MILRSPVVFTGSPVTRFHNRKWRPGVVRHCVVNWSKRFDMSAPKGSYTVTWVDPSVSVGQIALREFQVWYTDLDTAETGVCGTVSPGVQTFTGSVLQPSKRYKFAVQAIDVNGAAGPMSTQSNELDSPAPPGAPTEVVAVIN